MMTMREELNTEKIWTGVLSAMKLVVSEGTFNTYFKQATLTNMEASGERLLCEISCTSGYVKAMLESRYWGQIASEMNRLTEKTCELRFVIRAHDPRSKAQENLGPLFEQKVDEGWRRARLKEEYTFDNYAVGGSNQMAYAAGVAVAKKPGIAYNPLFIYGGVGLGKTHLMHAIGHELLKRGEGPVLFCSGEEFTNDLVEGIRTKSTEKVRNKYRRVKLLLIDDVQFIAGKATVQEEFFHTFNSIQREGGQVVMTSDKPPSEIAKLEERLKSRFGAGMIVDVGPADFELRTAILLIKAKQKQISLPMEAAQTMANLIEGIRELEGVLTRVNTEAEITGVSISKTLVEKALKISSRPNISARIVTPNEVIELVSQYYGVNTSQIKGERRTKTIVVPRQILMYLLRFDLKLPLEEVGRLIGGRDHTTVMHATEKIGLQITQDEGIKNQIEILRSKILSG
jgi:chromosomal replication initiator protein